MASNTEQIEKAILATIPLDRPVVEQELAEMVAQLSKVWAISAEERNSLVRQLHSRLMVKMDMGAVLAASEHAPWLSARKPQLTPFYWNRYRLLLTQLAWPPRVAGTLDGVTDQVLDLCGDPSLEGSWKRRGLVMGDVQSGKTATYTGLCCKAADAGYRLIILLTGTMENLRRQTQERLDAGFIGLDSSGVLSAQRQSRLVGVGLIDRSRTGVVLTSRNSDFDADTVNSKGFRLAAFNECALLVVKKNKKILQNLHEWLKGFNAGSNGLIETPLLLIDDEADNASINTAAENSDPTAINEGIRALLSLFTRSTYVGFTATPFANIFIDPDSVHEMVEDDLFPRDFVYALDPPTNYRGPASVFGDDSNGDELRDIEDAEAIFPAAHKSTLVVSRLPESLAEAIRAFLVANAVRDLRDHKATHRSMLVNVSRFTNVQKQVFELVDEALRKMQEDIRNYSALPEQEALRNPTLAALRQTWGREFESAGFSWEDVQRTLVNAALPVTTRLVNQSTGAASLDYAIHRTNGLRVIAVGGNALSRGLTLEGLCTSFFFRSSQMYDTLLQMGRWFGYRDGYRDLCRIWLTAEARHWYSYITSATEELRAEIKRMQADHLTPREFGLKVRAHPDSLIVTARNKMRNAKLIERIVSVSGQAPETPHLRADRQKIRENANAVIGFIRSIEMSGIKREASPLNPSNFIWRNVSKSAISGLLRAFQSHPRNLGFQGSALADLLDSTDAEALRTWDVALPSGEGERRDLVEGLQHRPQIRHIEIAGRGDLLVSGKSARVASRGIEREGMDVDLVRRIEEDYRKATGKKSPPDRIFRAKRSRPLLLIHSLSYREEHFPSGPERTEVEGAAQSPLIALGLSFPPFDDSNDAQRVTYRVNLVEWRNLFAGEVEDDERDEYVAA